MYYKGFYIVSDGGYGTDNRGVYCEVYVYDDEIANCSDERIDSFWNNPSELQKNPDSGYWMKRYINANYDELTELAADMDMEI